MLKSVHRAKYVLAEPDHLLQNAAVHISNPGRISRIEPWNDPPAIPGVEVIDWGAAVIMPGLINAHAHLELTRLKDQLLQFRSFTDWVSQLIDRRRSWTKEEFLNSTKEGVEAALASGTTLVGDITSSGFGWDAAEHEDLRRIVFEEATGFSPGYFEDAVSQLEARLDRSSVQDSLRIHGVSPHAPYSVSPQLYRYIAELSRQRGFPLATHVAETRSELEFLQAGTGEFRNLLERLGAMTVGWEAPSMSPIPYLESLGVLGQSSVLVHCNYVDQDSINRILNTRSSVVYCPRSHAFFGHDKHPIRQLLDLGINVALGTDSLASNSSLSMLDEMRHLFKIRKDLRTEEIFRAATLNGASALGFGGILGRLRRGYWADLAVLRLPETVGPRQLTNQVLEGAGENIATIVRGEIAWRKTEQNSA